MGINEISQLGKAIGLKVRGLAARLPGSFRTPAATLPKPASQPIWGFSFSRRQCEYFGLVWEEALRHIVAQTGLKHVRLSAYWHEIEHQTGEYDFAMLMSELALCAELKLDVMLTIGMKAQRYPEFYLPEILNTVPKVHSGVGFAQRISPLRFFSSRLDREIGTESTVAQRTLSFLEALLPVVRNHPAVTTIQVENEPLDPSGPDGYRIAGDLLKREFSLVRRNVAADTTLCLNFWGNDFKHRHLSNVQKLMDELNPDFVGFDFYPRQPRNFVVLGWLGGLGEKLGLLGLAESTGLGWLGGLAWLGFRGPDMSRSQITQLNSRLRHWGISPIICELQAEPWENFNYIQQPEKITSISPKLITENVAAYARLGFDRVYLWGAEYWLWSGIGEKIKLILQPYLRQ